MRGRVVGKYRLIAPIGEGGMGVVYRAEHEVLGSPAAVKILLPEYTRDPAQLQRFFAEAKTSSAIRHPGIALVFDFGKAGDDTFLAMELLRGESLHSFLGRRGALPAPLAIQIAAQMFAALDAVHVRGVVHRDLKPDNVFLVRDRTAPGGIRIKLLDFGIAKLVDDADRAGGVSGPRPKTKGGVILGTPTYMAPEQCRVSSGGTIDARADLYATGCILFQMLTGRPPFVAEANAELMAMHMYEPPPRVSSLVRGLPIELEPVIAKLLIKAPADRIPSAGFALAELERVPAPPLTGEVELADDTAPPKPAPVAPDVLPQRRSWTLPVVVLLVALAVAGGAIYWIGFRDDGPGELRGSVLEDRVRILHA